jgi:hypothetical protein
LVKSSAFGLLHIQKQEPRNTPKFTKIKELKAEETPLHSCFFVPFVVLMVLLRHPESLKISGIWYQILADALPEHPLELPLQLAGGKPGVPRDFLHHQVLGNIPHSRRHRIRRT